MGCDGRLVTAKKDQKGSVWREGGFWFLDRTGKGKGRIRDVIDEKSYTNTHSILHCD